MGAHPHTMFDGYGNRVVHYGRIAGMPGAGNVGRGDELDNGIIQPQFVSTETLPHIAVEIYFFHGVSPFKSEKTVSKHWATGCGSGLFGQHQVGKKQGDIRKDRQDSGGQQHQKEKGQGISGNLHDGFVS
jgi:hypothetical protein